jgi:dipeptidyl-peptidase-4
MGASARWAPLLAFCVLSVSAFAQKKPITIHDLFANGPKARAPEAVWRPDGAAFAYIENGKLWLYDIESRHATPWLSVDDLEKRSKQQERPEQAPFGWQNRRVDISGPQWFPDGGRVFLPMRTSSFVLDAGAAKPRERIPQIAQNNAPALSPDGKRVLFRKGANLYVLDLSSRKTVRITSDGSPTKLNGQLDWVYPEELELGTAAWWSPDSQKIAYLQFDIANEFSYPHADLLSTRAIFEPQRYPQAGTPNASVKVGVVMAAGGSTRWMNLGRDKDVLIARVNWSPDSKRLAIQRLTRVQDRLDLISVDTATGETKSILTETDKTWINVENDLRFLPASHQFLWSSERTGFRHLYLYSENGELRKQLTSGEWQVSRVVAVNEKQRFVYFTSSEASPLEDQLYRVSLDGGARERLSKGSGMHEIQSNERGDYYLDTFSNLSTPPETTLHTPTGAQLAVVRAIDRTKQNKFDILPAEIVTAHAADGTVLYARLIRPAHFDASRKYPAIVFVYGGPRAQSVRNTWPGLSWEQVLAHQGFVIWQLDNRGSFGRGHAFENPVYREFGKTELHDQRTGVEKLLSMGFIDKDRIGIYGWSFGGYLTLYSLLHAPDLFKAGVAGAPVTDWHNYDTIYTERYMGLPDENEEGYRKSSIVLAAAHLEGKLLIVCNFEDDNVLFQNTMQMMTALHNANKEFDFMLYPQKTHGVTGNLAEGMHQQMTDFFVRSLRP